MLSQKTRKKITNQKVPSKNKKTHPKIVWKPPPHPLKLSNFFQANEHFLSWLCLYPLAAHTKLSAASRFGFAHAFRMRAWKKDKIKSAKKKNNSLFPPIERFGSFFVFETFFCSWDLFLAFWKPKTRLFPIHSKTHVPTIPNQTSWWLQPIWKNHESETWIISSRVSGEHKKCFLQPAHLRFSKQKQQKIKEKLRTQKKKHNPFKSQLNLEKSQVPQKKPKAAPFAPPNPQPPPPPTSAVDMAETSAAVKDAAASPPSSVAPRMGPVFGAPLWAVS